MKQLKRSPIYIFAISLLPLIFFSSHYYYTGQDSIPEDVNDAVHWLIDWSFSFVVSLVIFYGIYFFLRLLNKRLPWGSAMQNAKRIVLEAVVLFLFTPTVILVIKHFYGVMVEWYPTWDDFDRSTVFSIVATVLIVTVIAVTIWEARFLFVNWQNSALSTEKLKKENAVAQLKGLQNQLDPHFLFNNLNALSSLVRKDTDKAEAFIDQLAVVYRYVLASKEQHLVPLEQELHFIKAYLFLLEIRFGDGIAPVLQLEEDNKSYWLPPLTLQEVIGNAIKHNRTDATQPLHVHITQKGNELTVVNELSLRMDVPKSTGTGITNILERYALLNGKMPQFEQTATAYSVVLPLLEEEQEELMQ